VNYFSKWTPCVSHLARHFIQYSRGKSLNDHGSRLSLARYLAYTPNGTRMRGEGNPCCNARMRSARQPAASRFVNTLYPGGAPIRRSLFERNIYLATQAATRDLKKVQPYRLERKRGAKPARSGVNVNCPIKSSYARRKCVVNATVRRPGNNAGRRYPPFKRSPPARIGLKESRCILHNLRRSLFPHSSHSDCDKTRRDAE
jgi:hypothetical protein